MTFRSLRIKLSSKWWNHTSWGKTLCNHCLNSLTSLVLSWWYKFSYSWKTVFTPAARIFSFVVFPHSGRTKLSLFPWAWKTGGNSATLVDFSFWKSKWTLWKQQVVYFLFIYLFFWNRKAQTDDCKILTLVISYLENVRRFWQKRWQTKYSCQTRAILQTIVERQGTTHWETACNRWQLFFV